MCVCGFNLTQRRAEDADLVGTRTHDNAADNARSSLINCLIATTTTNNNNLLGMLRILSTRIRPTRLVHVHVVGTMQ